MTKQEILEIVQNSIPLSKSEGDARKKMTVLQTYHIGDLSGNRLNSGTIRSQYIFCPDTSAWENSSPNARRAIHSDQLVFVQVGDDEWDAYQGADENEGNDPVPCGHFMGLENYLLSMRLPVVGDSGLDDAKKHYLAAIRTKPFILLAGISGTGKSRLVRQLARGCCPVGHDLGKDAEGHVDAAQKPGNFEIIPVRPNWHDSTELVGYVTRITADNKPEFVIKPFVRFLAKAMVQKDVPFFLCLDEMNLAPVEQYFAEYLSAVETRKKTANGIVSDVLVNFDLPEIDVKATVKALMKDWIDVAEDGTVAEKTPNAKAVYDAIVADKGLRIPPNLVVMGTVNMDETTCSFSRKVLDRAMTFELNKVNMDEGLDSDNSIPYGSIPADQAFATDVEGCDFYMANKALCDTVKTYLLSVNAVLEDTPFKFAYRSRNEIMLYCIERTKGGAVSPARALDEATSMKILSRIEGDDQKLLYVGDNPAYKDKTILDALKGEIAAALKVVNGGTDPVDCTVCAKKIDFMARRLGGGFTNFFV